MRELASQAAPHAPGEAPVPRPDDGLKKQYLQTVQGTLAETGRRSFHATIVLAALVTLLIGLSVGGLQIDGDVQFSGIKLLMGSSFPLAACSVGVSLVQIHLLMLERYRSRLRRVVLRLYRELGFSDPDLSPDGYPIESPSLFSGPATSAIASQDVGWWHERAFTALFLVGPVAAQVIAALVLSVRPARLWMVATVVVFVLLSIRDCLAYGRGERAAAEDPAAAAK